MCTFAHGYFIVCGERKITKKDWILQTESVLIFYSLKKNFYRTPINKNEKFIHVRFLEGEKKFIFPDAFMSGYLKMGIKR